MLVIRDAQMRVFGQLTRDRFEQSLTAALSQNYPRESRQAGGEAQLRLLVARGIASAQTHGLTTQREVRIFVNLMMMLGADFPRDLQLPWASEGLAEESFPDPTMRCELLFRAALSYLQATAGKHGELIVRALLRVRALDLATVPATVDEAWPTTICALWEALYPEKFRFQGQAASRALLQHAIPAAAGYGLGDGVGTFVHATLMFFLGMGYADDPLHPWAATVLKDASLPSGPALGLRLHAAAMNHLEQSLASG